jgi:MFS family permease
MWSEIKGVPARTFVVCLIAYGFSQLDLALFSYAVPSLRKDLDLTLNQMSLVVSVSYILGGLMQVWFGHLTDRFGRKAMMQISLAGAGIFVALHSVVPDAVWLTLARAAALFAGGALYPATGAAVTEVAPARYRGILAGLLQTAYPMGWFIASLFAAPLLVTYGWRVMFLVALLSVPYVWVIRATMSEPERFKEASAVTKDRGLWQSIGQLFAPDMRRRAITLFIAQFLFVVAYGGSAIYFPTFFVEARGLKLDSSAYLVGLGNAVGVLGYIMAAFTGEFLLTRRTTVVIWTLLGAAAFMVLIWGTTGFTETIVAFAVMTMFFYGTAAVKFAYVAEIFPTHLRATGLVVCGSLAVNFGTALGPLMVSTAVGRFGWDIAFTVVVGVPLVAAGLFYLVLKPVPSGIDVDEVQRHFAASRSK